MSLVCGVDFESSGLDPVKDRIVEVGAVLYQWETRIPLVLQSALVFAGVTLSQELTDIHGITNEMLGDYGRSEEAVFEDLRSLMSQADYVMAHFGNDFDQKFCRETFARLNIPWPDKLWLDTSIDVVYEEKITTRNLQYLAAEMGFVNPYRHRAVFDVLTMLRVASEFPLEKIVARAKEPTVYVQALVSYEEKEKAKEKGYRWFAPTKTWWHAYKESDWLAEKETCEFRTAMLLGAPE